MSPIRSLAAVTLFLGAWTSSTPAPVPAAAPRAITQPIRFAPPARTAGAHVMAADACSLLTQQEVSAALGVAVEKGQPVVPNSPNLCGWAPPGGPKIDGKKVTLFLSTAQQHDIGRTPMQGIEKSPVSGVGDDAYYVTTPGFGTAINVKRGAKAFQIRVGGFPPDKEKAIEKSLALLVLKRL